MPGRYGHIPSRVRMSRTATRLDDQAVKLLREYLQIPSVQPEVDYTRCEEWIRIQAASIGLPVHVERPGKKNKPVVIISWIGTEPDLPSIMLNSHMDVVPTTTQKWLHPPFAAEGTENGNDYGRGAQDMKIQGVQYLEAVRRLRIKGFQPRRSVHIVFVPDEEIGGEDGMGAFVKTKTFDGMKVGFELDEGISWPGDEFIVFNAERTSWRLEFVCHGTPGYSYLLTGNTAAERVTVILNRLMEYKSKEKKRIRRPEDQGSVTSVNVTMLNGESENNTIPSEVTLVADARIAPGQEHGEFPTMVQKWCEEAGDTEVSFRSREDCLGVTELNEGNKWWTAFKSVMERMNQKLIPAVCPGSTDARFLRALNIPALGVSFINNTKPQATSLMHNKDEFINEKVFLRGITIYEKLIRNLTAL